MNKAFEKQATFSLEVRKPIKKKFIKALAPSGKTGVMEIYQYLEIGDKIYVFIRLYSKDRWSGKDLYIIMNKTGNVIDWCYDSFIV
ncbi:hypothetical protein [Pontibacter harenae]|uniref:hypothetical protein n=1 Tax=Pontibacter harenae TaxID=2894083 RepID=UPI001E3833B5|nr:hypothetical protein [Pontibacter harenae]MCC9167758.1 hypothetical protein [Pontibacter harenae]